ncbi:MAG: 50S ribosomal protein L10 [Candidatus Omnitrophota bacterium]
MRANKVTAIEKWREGLSQTEFIIFVGFSRITVSEVTEFRKEVKKAGGRFKVIKNTLFSRALEGLALTGAKDLVSGPTGIISFSGGDELPLIKFIFRFTKDKEGKLTFRGGYQKQVPVSAEQLAALAKLPDRKAVLSRFCGTLLSPISRLVFTLNAVPQQLLSVLKQSSEKPNA